MTRSFSQIKGLLLDLNGVFYTGEQLLKGAIEAIEFLKSNKVPHRFITNTTTESLDTFHNKLTQMGLPIDKSEIISSPYAAVLYLRQRGKPKCHLLLAEDTKKDFAAFPVSDTEPDFVVIGDMGDRWNYHILNQAFQLLSNGAELIALHKGKYWQVEDGLRLDIGAFVTGLEYATGKTATVIGKPDSAFFQLALEELGLPNENVAMVGDDIDSDVGGAKLVGLTGVLVKTGKYREESAARSEVQADAVLESIADLKQIFEN